jgi:regulator of sigma E protease
MAGQEDAPRTSEERDREYGHVPPDRFYSSKPVWQRSIVIFAGPFMNLVLGVLLYGVVALVGAEVPEAKVDARIGAVLPGSAASQAPMYRVPEDVDPDAFKPSGEPDTRGWQTGDRVISIDGQKVNSVIQDVRIEAVLGGGRTLEVVLERTQPDGSKAYFLSPVEPKVAKGEEHAQLGVGPYQTALIREVQDGMPAARAGLQPGDVVLSANGKPVDAVTLTEMVEKMDVDKTLSLEVRRGSEEFDVQLQPEIVGRISGVLFEPSLHISKPEEKDRRPVVLDTSTELEEKVGLKRKDIIVAVDGKPATVGLLEEIEETRFGDDVPIRVERPAIFFGLLRRGETLDLELPVRKVGAIGIVWKARTVFHREPPENVVPEAFRQGYLALARTVETVKILVTGSGTVQPKDLGGPVMIFNIMADARKLGYTWLLEMTAFISINLCVFNLLPLPVLDGGQLLFLGVEAIRRKPLDMRILERVQQMGLVFIVLLILFVTFNDIQRVFESIIP